MKIDQNDMDIEYDNMKEDPYYPFHEKEQPISETDPSFVADNYDVTFKDEEKKSLFSKAKTWISESEERKKERQLLKLENAKAKLEIDRDKYKLRNELAKVQAERKKINGAGILEKILPKQKKGGISNVPRSFGSSLQNQINRNPFVQRDIPHQNKFTNSLIMEQRQRSFGNSLITKQQPKKPQNPFQVRW